MLPQNNPHTGDSYSTTIHTYSHSLSSFQGIIDRYISQPIRPRIHLTLHGLSHFSNILISFGSPVTLKSKAMNLSKLQNKQPRSLYYPYSHPLISGYSSPHQNTGSNTGVIKLKLKFSKRHPVMTRDFSSLKSKS